MTEQHRTKRNLYESDLTVQTPTIHCTYNYMSLHKITAFEKSNNSILINRIHFKIIEFLL